MKRDNKLFKRKKPNRYLKRRELKPMTCIIGVKCADGILIVGDRRVLRGTEYSDEPKILQPFHNFVVGASGVSGLMDKFLYEMDFFLRSPEAKDLDWRSFGYALEDIASNLFARYRARLEVDETVEIGAYYFDVLFGCKPFETEAKLYHLYRNGFSQEVKRFDIIGHGQPHALPFIKALYKESRTMNEMVKVAGFTLKLIDEARIDLSVGGEPQIWLIPNDKDTNAEELPPEKVNNILGKAAYPTSIMETILKI